jgi:small conductance mechanosensitive channel
MTIAGLMVLQEFGVEIAPIWQQPGIVGQHLVLEVTLSEILFLSFIILENQYRVGDIVNFDNAGGTFKRSV